MSAPTTDRGHQRVVPDFDRQSGTVKAITAAGGCYALALMVGFWASLQDYTNVHNALSGQYMTLEGLDNFDVVYGVATLTELVLYLLVIVLFCVWLLRAGRNIRALGVEGMMQSEESRVIWFFVPVAQLVLPLQGIRELWRASASEDHDDWRTVSAPAWLHGWWSLWLVSFWTGIAGYTVGGSDVLEEIARADQLDMWAQGTRLLALPLMLMVVHGVQRHQNALAASVGRGSS